MGFKIDKLCPINHLRPCDIRCMSFCIDEKGVYCGMLPEWSRKYIPALEDL
jgi:hypothetical protein